MPPTPDPQLNPTELQAIIDTSTDCIKVLDLDARVLSMNPGGLEVMEIDDFSVCQNVPWPTLWDGLGRGHVERALEAARSGNSTTFEGEARTFAGTPKWWEVRVSPLWAPDGSVTRLLAISRDITARKVAEQHLHDTQQLLRDHAQTLEVRVSQQERALDAFVRFTTQVASSTDLADLATAAGDIIQDAVSGATSGLYLIQGQTAFPAAFSRNTPPAVRAARQAGVPLGTPLVADALTARRTVFAQGDEGRVQSVGYASALSVTPYFHGDQPYALFATGTGRPVWTVQEQAVIESVGRGLGLALERAEQTQRLQERTASLDAFVAFSEAVGSQEGQRDLARRACEVLHATFEDGTAVYYEPDGELWRGVAWAGDLPAATLALVRQGVPGSTVGIAQSVAARDAVFIDGWRDEVDDTAQQTREYGAAGFFPVMVDGEVVGLLTTGLKTRAYWNASDQAVMRGVGRGLTLAAERAGSVRALREQAEVVEARNRALEGFAVLARDLAFETDPLVLVKRAQEIVLEVLPEGFGLYYRPEGGLWRLRVQTGDLGNDELQAVVDAGLPLEETRNLWIPFQSGAPYYQDSYDTNTDGLGELVSEVGATACLPVHADGSVVGVLAVGLFGSHRWSAVDHALLETAVLMLELAFERSAAARQLAEQQAQLRAANEELGAFAYTVSHDLRAPVRHVGSFAGLLRRKIGDTPGLLKYVDQIESAASRMEVLTDALLGLARAGAAQLVKTDVDLNVLFAAARSDLTPELDGRTVTWRIGELPVVRADAGLLRQVLANLLGNAVKYSGGREEAVIDVWAEDAPGEVMIAVRDNGAGFEPQYASKLFGVFQRLHHQSEFEGTGVGLANVKRIVEKHGGRVWAEGRPGEGATFFFSLPQA
ncbi:PAS domain S-box-containing protein [Deinococcus metalli]|uniref:histidine kinase n=1 Tax=Deinococcus metalli TaxID=1141878 RepID=A0A7W8KH30_9DEIO|nr:ATP-binding protein [Deinococcus metalli]MBB5378072.1 PAS domain S-box-containing protein [Deinococcus metalli]GHF54213.1 hypothetical protein GCM10017781_33130 [Deinococcus metalli]